LKSPKRCFLRETRGVQVLDFEVGELRSQPFPQVILGAFGDPAQVAKGPPGLGGDQRLVRAEELVYGQLAGPA
jgi:hypothetical protein